LPKFRRQSEVNKVEVKAARGGTPQRLYESLSAFANRTGGDVLLFGLNEKGRFEAVGVGDLQWLQEEVGHLASGEMEPALRPEFTVDEIDGETVVAAEISEVPASQRPCDFKPAGLQRGAYIRVGNTNRQMTDYEVFRYVSVRSQPTFDQEPVPDASLDDLDPDKLDAYLAHLRRTRPRAASQGTMEEALAHQHVVQPVAGVLRPTLAGLLMFGKYPQEFEIQLVITYLQFYGTTETEKTPRSERFLDNRKFEGPVPQMVTEAVDYVLSAMRKSSLIDGLYRRDIPEYPQEAVREAIINAVAHRDYSGFARGSYIQIRMFADRLEIQSPGGLYGTVTEENLEVEHSTRNRHLMRLMEDLHLVENRGSGIKSMLEAMRQANLEPPRFEDRRSSFWVTFRNHSLMSPEAITWLNQFAGLALNDRQRLALVYLRHNERITNNDYQRLARVDSVTAGRELRGLVQADLIDQQSAKRWTYYTLKAPRDLPKAPLPASDEEKILARVREKGSINNAECRQLLGVSVFRASRVLKALHDRGLLKRTGGKRWTKYELP
jgi:ATP-dependent DNA helicase RecG